MKAPKDYLSKNRIAWNKMTDINYGSEMYDVERFKQGHSTLSEIELDLLGDISGLSILHLQCHFGQDSISLARMGAGVVGVDLSDRAVEKGRALAAELGADVRFVCCDLYNLPNHLDERFDIVFTSYGTIGWLPDLDRWAAIVDQYLKPGGRFVFAEFHQVVWMFDEDFNELKYGYFNTEAFEEEFTGSYADRTADAKIACVDWNHPISEVMTSLLGVGLQLAEFHEFDYSPWNCFKGTTEIAPGKYAIEKHISKIPLTYSMLWTKKAE